MKNEELEESEIANDIKINQFSLDKECISQAPLYYKYSEMLREAKSRLSAAKDNLDYTKGSVYLEIVNSLDKKPTEKAIESMIATDKRIKEALLAVREAEAYVIRLNNVTGAMDTKRSELDNLVKLTVSGVYADRNDSVNETAKEEKRDKAAKKIREKLNKKKMEV